MLLDGSSVLVLEFLVFPEGSIELLLELLVLFLEAAAFRLRVKGLLAELIRGLLVLLNLLLLSIELVVQLLERLLDSSNVQT